MIGEALSGPWMDGRYKLHYKLGNLFNYYIDYNKYVGGQLAFDHPGLGSFDIHYTGVVL